MHEDQADHDGGLDIVMGNPGRSSPCPSRDGPRRAKLGGSPRDFYTKVRTELGTLAIGFGERGVTRILLPAADWHDLGPAELARAGLQTEARPLREIARLATKLRA